MARVAPTPAHEASTETLFHLVALVRAELVRRGDPLAPNWVDQAVSDLRTGTLQGWYYPPDAPGAGIGFYSAGGHRAYAHVHVEPGEEAGERAHALVTSIVESLPPPVVRCDVGITGLSPSEEAELGKRLVPLGGEMVVRWAMDRPIGPADGAPLPAPPAVTHHVGAFVPSLEELVELDRRAFAGTPDETLVADTVEDERRVIKEVLEGRLGRFLAEASTVLVDGNGRPRGAALSAEETPTKAVLLDLLVDPAFKRRGVGRYLLAWTFRALHALGYESVGLWVTAANTPARTLYESSGFTPRLSALIYRYERPAGSAPH